MSEIRRMATLRSVAEFHEYVQALGVEIPLDDTLGHGVDDPLAQPYRLGDRTIGNRFAVLPMEGWDATVEGLPSDRTFRRWKRFGASGAKLIWGGEAVAVREDGRASPNELLINDANLSAIETLRTELVNEHLNRYGSTEDLYIGLQLTHSGRYSKPHDHARPEPKIVYRHPILDRRLNLADDYPLVDDDDLKRLTASFVEAAKLAFKAGYDFVDIKQCHSYLGHELLSAVDRPGEYGGSFENRTRFVRNVIAGVRSEAPGLKIGVRLNAADWRPFKPGEDGRGIPEPWPAPFPQARAGGGDSPPYPYAFGGDGTGLGVDLSEPIQLIDQFHAWGVELLCVTLGSPYYNPHFLRPALFPPTDGYKPPEDPLVGVARHIAITALLKRRRPELAFVGSGYSYLQERLAEVGRTVAARGMADFIGVGRMALSYPELPADALAGRAFDRKRVCRTFSDCTSSPRNGLPSGCYPLDPFYKNLPEAHELKRKKALWNEKTIN